MMDRLEFGSLAFLFFFQAEDGIRDTSVTGVQTCALPISRCNPGRHRDRRNPAVTRGERLRCRDQTTTPFVEERRHRRKPLSDGFDIDHHHNIWYDITVVNPYFTLSKVDSIIFGRVLSFEQTLLA